MNAGSAFSEDGSEAARPQAFEPVCLPDRGPPASAAIDPDRSKSWWRRVVPLLLARRWRVIGSLVGALVSMLIGVVIPRVTMQAIDKALIDRTEQLVGFVWILVALGLIRAVVTYFYRTTLYGTAYRLEYDLRVIMFDHLSRLSFSFYDRVQSGQIISRANSDIRSVQMFLTFAPLMVLNMVSFLAAIAFMIDIHVGLTLAALASVPLVYVAGARLRNLSFPLSWIVQGRLAEIATVVDENVNGVRVVKSFAAEERQIGHLARAAQRLRWASLRTVHARAAWAPVMENLPRLALAGVLLYGGWLAIDGAITVGALVAFNAYVVMLQAPFRMLGFLLMLGQRAAASAGRIYEILDEPVEIVDRPGAVDLVDPRGEIVFDKVDYSYRRPGDERPVPVLRGFDLRIQAGETVALVGRTGSGKSTVARLLSRFYDIDAGAIRIDGHDIRDLTLASLRHHIGVVLDEPFLFSTSLHDNIAFARPDATRDEVIAAARAAQAHDFIMDLPDGYDTVIGERGYDLSGGQRQRVAIARALLANPPILVLDDATSAVDVHVEEAIHRALTERLAHRTTIVIAHRLSTIALADRVALLENGRVAALGTHAELLAEEPRYAAVLARTEPAGIRS